MTKRSDNIIQFDPKRRRKPVPPQETPKKPKKPLPKLNMGYLVIGLFLLGYLGINFLNNRPQSGALEFTVKGDTAYGFGTTDSSSYGYVSEFLNAQPQVKRLVLKNMPGTIDGRTNMQIAALIRKRRLSTHLEHDSYIASGAVDLFIAGAQRSMVCGAKIGVHSWRTASGSSPDTVARDSYLHYRI